MHLFAAFPALLVRRETAMTNRTRTTRSLNITISGLILTSALMTVGCAQAFARHDLVQRSNVGIERAVNSAQRTCQERQPKNALPSAAEYERCVLVMLRDVESLDTRR
jgi:hypothetical protein